MALHRDIYWVGRQWAVTGYGMQLIDQKLKGIFDIEAARLWDDDLIDSLRAKEWLNAEDFDKGLAVARTRYPQPPHAATPAPDDRAGRQRRADGAASAGAKPKRRARAAETRTVCSDAAVAAGRRIASA